MTETLAVTKDEMKKAWKSMKREKAFWKSDISIHFVKDAEETEE